MRGCHVVLRSTCVDPLVLARTRLLPVARVTWEAHVEHVAEAQVDHERVERRCRAIRVVPLDPSIDDALQHGNVLAPIGAAEVLRRDGRWVVVESLLGLALAMLGVQDHVAKSVLRAGRFRERRVRAEAVNEH